MGFKDNSHYRNIIECCKGGTFIKNVAGRLYCQYGKTRKNRTLSVVDHRTVCGHFNVEPILNGCGKTSSTRKAL
jgi:hypothetical protein